MYHKTWISPVVSMGFLFNTLRPRQNGRHFADDIFKRIFLNENAWISLDISLKFVPTVRIDNIPTLVQIMAWRRPGDKPSSEPMMVSLLTHICVTRPQSVNGGLRVTKCTTGRYQKPWVTHGSRGLSLNENRSEICCQLSLKRHKGHSGYGLRQW